MKICNFLPYPTISQKLQDWEGHCYCGMLMEIMYYVSNIAISNDIE